MHVCVGECACVWGVSMSACGGVSVSVHVHVWGPVYTSPSVFSPWTLSWSSAAVSCISPPPP